MAEQSELAESVQKIGNRATGDTELDVMIAASASNTNSKLVAKLGKGNTMLNIMLDPDASDSYSSGDNEKASRLPSKPSQKPSAEAQRLATEAATKVHDALQRADTLARAKQAADAEALALSQVSEKQIQDAQKLLKTLKPRLGLAIEQSRASQKGQNGVKVTGVISESSAELAGFQVGDIIMLLNGVRVHSNQVFIAEQKRIKPGDDMHMTIRRKDRELDIIARMGAVGYNLEQVVKIRAMATASSDRGVVNVIRNTATTYKGCFSF